MRKPRDYQKWDVPVGILFVRIEEDGRWVILASHPDIKVDNKHMDRRPHMHIGGWDSDDRRLLREDISVEEAAAAIRRHLTSEGYIDTDILEDELS